MLREECSLSSDDWVACYVLTFTMEILQMTGILPTLLSAFIVILSASLGQINQLSVQPLLSILC